MWARTPHAGQAPVVRARVTIWIGRNVLDDLLEEAARCAPLETGGVLLGWRTEDAVCITNMVGPGPDARHARDSFSPDATWQSDQIALLYARSGRRLAYLGDWHTHPGAVPVPSSRDRGTLRAIARHVPARCPEPIMIILGQPRDEKWVVAGHTIRRDWWARSLRTLQVPLRTATDLEGWD
ncbi:Mov34/MPN/PAD-1 family protein [Arthrobacter subterraneus]|uniref:Mov34/MPN/PAD-1 family protein n=1 Tax=Arthrobacter subterraneus TaxID=335973 RepID=UPI000B884CC4